MHPTVAVADPRAEAGRAGHKLPAGRLKARLLLLLFVPLLHLALAHPARCQKDGVIRATYCSCRERGAATAGKIRHVAFLYHIREHLQIVSPGDSVRRARFLAHFDIVCNFCFHPCLMIV